jgi:uracil phosphoribosyltransferase
MSQKDSPVDRQYASVPYRPCEIVHKYGEQVHIQADPLALTMLARLCAKGTVQPEANGCVPRARCSPRPIAW